MFELKLIVPDNLVGGGLIEIFNQKLVWRVKFNQTKTYKKVETSMYTPKLSLLDLWCSIQRAHSFVVNHCSRKMIEICCKIIFGFLRLCAKLMDRQNRLPTWTRMQNFLHHPTISIILSKLQTVLYNNVWMKKYVDQEQKFELCALLNWDTGSGARRPPRSGKHWIWGRPPH